MLAYCISVFGKQASGTVLSSSSSVCIHMTLTSIASAVAGSKSCVEYSAPRKLLSMNTWDVLLLYEVVPPEVVVVHSRAYTHTHTYTHI